MMLINLVAVLLLALLLVFMLNSSHVFVRRTDLQGVADEAAYSAALVKSRALNALAGTNHCIGEGLALIVVHHALGGDLLDNHQAAEEHGKHKGKLNRLNKQLSLVARAARQAGARTPFYDTVRQSGKIYAEATLLQAKMRLKQLLIADYEAKLLAKAMQAYPPTAAAGRALETAMDLLELQIGAEYRILNQFQQAAEAALSFKRQLRDQHLPSLKRYTEELVELSPQAVQEVAQVLATRAGAQRAFVPHPELPVHMDPLARAEKVPQIPAVKESQPGACPCRSVQTDITRDQIVKVTQLARATFPFVAYHREPVWRSLQKLVPLSGAGDFYKDHSDGYSKILCDRYQTDEHDLGLYVLRDYSAPDKGYELWTVDRNRADLLFGTLVVVHMDAPTVIGEAVFGNFHASGQIAFAEGLSYGANPQVRPPARIDLRCKRITPNQQAEVGWDTLQWVAQANLSGSESKMPSELIAKTDQGSAPAADLPLIQLNWQAKLVPTSSEQVRQLKQASDIPSSMRGLVQRLLEPAPSPLLTH